MEDEDEADEEEDEPLTPDQFDRRQPLCRIQRFHRCESSAASRKFPECSQRLFPISAFALNGEGRTAGPTP